MTAVRHIIGRGVHVRSLGATGSRRRDHDPVLEERDFPVSELLPLASNRSLGKRVRVPRRAHPGASTSTERSISGARRSACSPPAARSRASTRRRPRRPAASSSTTPREFRYEDDIPLVVPEVNPHAIAGYKKRGIIANPNCSTIQMVVALKPSTTRCGIERINVATYQSVSGAGKEAVDELASQTAALMSGRSRPSRRSSPSSIAFNVVPQIDEFQDNGYTKEEMKMVWETRKILEDPPSA